MRGRKAHLEQCQTEMQQMFENRTNLEQEFTERYLAMVETFQKQLFDLQVSDAQVPLHSDLQFFNHPVFQLMRENIGDHQQTSCAYRTSAR